MAPSAADEPAVLRSPRLRTAAAGTTRGVRLMRVRPQITFPIALLRSGPLRPAARSFATLAHRLGASSR